MFTGRSINASIEPRRIAIALILSYVMVLLFGFGRENGFLLGPQGKPQLIEYVGVRAAGELARDGNAAAAYDWTAHRARQQAVTQQTSGAYYPWPYPPTYLMVAAALAALPYFASALVWIVGSLAVLIAASARIVGVAPATLWVLAAPQTFINVSVAHTGFFVAGLMALGLSLLPTTPIAAGVAFGLLAFKPQLGLLLPVALLAAGAWRAIFAAAATIFVWVLVSLALYGIEPWLAFGPQLERITDIFRSGDANMNMLVSIYGLFRSLGVAHASALMPQGVITLAAAVAIGLMWRSNAPYELKAAALAVASLVASPYLYVYDLTVLIVALMFLYVHVRPVGFEDNEVAAIGIAGGLIFAFALLPVPVGLLANAIVAWIVWRRWYRWSEDAAFARVAGSAV